MNSEFSDLTCTFVSKILLKSYYSLETKRVKKKRMAKGHIDKKIGVIN